MTPQFVNEEHFDWSNTQKIFSKNPTTYKIPETGEFGGGAVCWDNTGDENNDAWIMALVFPTRILDEDKNILYFPKRKIQ